ncbi:predicted protein [Histoplasma mississippiense (nom. inval.)]|nr:predicted protein [Histoplasma mississippiense (nom. inval.)]EDN04677.1 predicted protein [Histoplasma mississippiense (nom. inval.)]
MIIHIFEKKLIITQIYMVVWSSNHQALMVSAAHWVRMTAGDDAALRKWK